MTPIGVFIARLAALVPKPRVNLTRFHGVIAPQSGLSSNVIPGVSARRCHLDTVKTASQRRAAMTWAQRLKRLFKADIETCRRYGRRVRIIANIEDAGVIKKILEHLDQRARRAVADRVKSRVLRTQMVAGAERGNPTRCPRVCMRREVVAPCGEARKPRPMACEPR